MVRPGGRASVSGVIASVFGSSGFLAGSIVNILAHTGSQCICAYRGDGFNIRHLKPLGELGQVVPVPTELKDEESVRRVIGRSNVVINLIGSREQTKNYSYDDAHVKTSHRLAKVAAEMGVERFIHMGALGADVNSTSGWLRSKAHSELVVRELFPEATILRLGPVFGLGDSFVMPLAQMSDSIGICLINKGQQKVQPVWVGDVANAVLNALTNPTDSIGKTFDIAGPKVLTMKDVGDRVYDFVFREPDYNYLPNPVARVAGLIQGLQPFRKYRRWAADAVEQAKYDLIIPADSSNPTLADLGIQPAQLESRLFEMTAKYEGLRSGLTGNGLYAKEFLKPHIERDKELGIRV